MWKKGEEEVDDEVWGLDDGERGSAGRRGKGRLSRVCGARGWRTGGARGADDGARRSALRLSPFW